MFSLHLLGLGFGVALTQVILSSQYIRLGIGSPYTWVFRRIVPWGATWFLYAFLTSMGLVAFIIPGIIISLRLFWADEFALVHGKGSIESLRESWTLTRDKGLSILVFQFLAGWAQLIIAFPAILLLFAIGQMPSQSALAELVQGSLSWLVVFVTYGAVHAPELAYFYGMLAARDSSGSRQPVPSPMARSV